LIGIHEAPQISPKLKFLAEEKANKEIIYKSSFWSQTSVVIFALKRGSVPGLWKISWKYRIETIIRLWARFVLYQSCNMLYRLKKSYIFKICRFQSWTVNSQLLQYDS
jgi:hypothetical protein